MRIAGKMRMDLSDKSNNFRRRGRDDTARPQRAENQSVCSRQPVGGALVAPFSCSAAFERLLLRRCWGISGHRPDQPSRFMMGWTPPDGIDVPKWRC